MQTRCVWNKKTSIIMIIGIVAAVCFGLLTAGLLAPAHAAGRSFENEQPVLVTTYCRSTYQKIAMEWEPVPGAESYEIYRSSALRGTYTEFATTKETAYKEEAGGDYYYKVRAVKGDQKSRWSMTVRIFGAGGYVSDMFYDDNGFTHFKVRVINRTDKDLYFYGQGLYNPAQAELYSVAKYDVRTKEEKGYPYPIRASLCSPMYKAVCVPAGSEDPEVEAKETELEVMVPRKLPRIGESGLLDETTGYKLSLTFYPEMEWPGFKLTVRNEPRPSKVHCILGN